MVNSQPDAGPQRPVVSSKHLETIFSRPDASDHARPDTPSVRSLGDSSVHDHVSVTGHSQPASGRFSASVRLFLLLLTGRAGPSETSVWSLIVTFVFSV